METELIKLLPNGASVVAVIFVVIMFLRQLDKANDLLKEVSRQYDARIYESQKVFQGQVLELAQRNAEIQRDYQGQIQKLIESSLNAIREMVVALKSLEVVINRTGGNNK